MNFFDKYYQVLQLPLGASDADIKSAYRSLAKKYHPDISGTTATRADFIRVNEAYEILMKRDAMLQEALRRKRAKETEPRRKKSTFDNPSARASTHADMRYEDFTKSPLYRTAMVMDSAFDYVFVMMGCLMVVAPIFEYVTESMNPENADKEPEFHFLPILLGIGFLYGLWYFLFKSKRIKKDLE